MMEDLLGNLPQEIWREILGRLPIRSILRCKYVCKSWRDLIESGNFVTSYTRKPGLAFAHRDMGYTVCDEACEPVFRFDLPPPRNQYLIHSRVVIDSANGLLLVWDGCDYNHDILFICNPMTREYIELPPLPTRMCVFGFGVSKLSGQYKTLCGDQYSSCHVYTLGRGGLWRSIAAAGNPIVPRDYAVSFNGNLHWLIFDLQEKNPSVCCFDLETELFTSFSLPPRDGGDWRFSYGVYRLCILEDWLYICDMADHLHVVIWRMNNYGDENSWVKEYTFDQRPHIHEIAFPVKVLANGDLLFTWNIDDRLFIYSENNEALVIYGILQRSLNYYFSNIAIYTPSFLSFKNMGIHNVQSLSFH